MHPTGHLGKRAEKINAMASDLKLRFLTRLGRLTPIMKRVLILLLVPGFAFSIGVTSTIIVNSYKLPEGLLSFLQNNAFFIPEIIQIFILIAILSQAILILEEGEDTHQREKKKATLDYIVSVWSFYEPPRRALDLKFGKLFVVPMNEMTVKDRMRAAELFNCMNTVSLGLITDALSEEIISGLYRGHFLHMRNKYSPFLEERSGFFPHYVAACDRFSQADKNPS